jgi:DNA-binding protein, YbaB/EbfC family
MAKRKGFGGGGGSMGNMNNMLKQAQKIQDQMEVTQKEIEEKTFEVSSGGGAVKIAITGKRAITKIEIAKDIVDPEDVEMLQDTVLTAVNEAIREVDKQMEDAMGKVTGGISMPGLF